MQKIKSPRLYDAKRQRDAESRMLGNMKCMNKNTAMNGGRANLGEALFVLIEIFKDIDKQEAYKQREKNK